MDASTSQVSPHNSCAFGNVDCVPKQTFPTGGETIMLLKQVKTYLSQETDNRQGKSGNKRKAVDPELCAPISHLCLDGQGGGTFGLPLQPLQIQTSMFDSSCKDDTLAFDPEALILWLYSRDIVADCIRSARAGTLRGKLPKLVERRTGEDEGSKVGFRLMFDLDIVAERPLPLGPTSSNELCVSGIAGSIVKSVRRFYPDAPTGVRRKEVHKPIWTHCKGTGHATRRVPATCSVFEGDACCDPQESDASDLFTCVILCPGEEMVPKEVTVPTADGEGVPGIKTGVHIVFPHLIVSTSQARLIRQTVVCDLDAFFATQASAPLNSIDDVVDEAVYVGAGLRMPYAHKVNRCPGVDGLRCKRGKVIINGGEDDCQAGCDNGKVCVPHSGYVLAGTLQNGRLRRREEMVTRYGAPERLTPGLYARLMGMNELESWSIDQTVGTFRFLTELASIRSAAPVSRYFKRYALAPSYLPMGRDIVRSGAGKMQWKTTQSHFTTQSGAPEHNKAAGIKLPSTSSEAILAGRIALGYGPEYAQASVRQVLKTATQYRVLLRAGTPGANFCHNKNADHGTNTVYFVIDTRGVRQRCWSNHVHNGVNCRHYSSDSIPVSQEDCMKLFNRLPPKTTGSKSKAAAAPPP